MPVTVTIALFGAMMIFGESCVSPVMVSVDTPFERVVEASGTQSELYLKANEWMVGIFRNADSVIEFSDKETGAIIGKYLMFGQLKPTGYMAMTLDSRIFAKIDVRVKDGKAKLTISPTGKWQYQAGTIYNYNVSDATRDMKAMGDSFAAAMQKDVKQW